MKNKNLGVELSRTEMKDVKGGYPPIWGGCNITCLVHGETYAVVPGCCADGPSVCASGGHTFVGCSCVGNPGCA